MQRLKIAFDVDDTLIVPPVKTDDGPHPYIGMYGAIPNYTAIELYKWFQSQGHYMIVWSGGGVDYAKTWADKLGLHPDEVRLKAKAVSICSMHFTPDNTCNICNATVDVDIAIDDQLVDLAKVNIQIH